MGGGRDEGQRNTSRIGNKWIDDGLGLKISRFSINFLRVMDLMHD